MWSETGEEESDPDSDKAVEEALPIDG